MLPYIIAGAAILLVIILAVILLIRRASKPPVAGAEAFRALLNVPPDTTPAPVPGNNPRLTELRQNLRVKLLYQEDKIDAAIAFERDRDPTAPLDQLMQRAITRWERDNQ